MPPPGGPAGALCHSYRRHHHGLALDSGNAGHLAAGEDAAGNISLRSAVEFVNAQASTPGSPNIINTPAGTYILSIDNGTSNQGSFDGGADDLVIGSATNLGTTLQGTTGIASDVIYRAVK